MVVRLHGRLLALLWACSSNAAESAGDAVCQAGDTCSTPDPDNADGYYWPRRGRNGSSVSPHSAPFNIGDGPAVVWKNSLDEQVRHTPLIDNEMNIYITTHMRVYKIGPDGGQKWVWTSPEHFGRITDSPTIHQGVLYGLSVNLPYGLYIFALDMASGKELWTKHMQKEVHADAHSCAVINGSIVFPFRDHPQRPYVGGEDGNNGVFAVSLADGSFLWEYVADDMHWNFMPSFPDDNTIIFASQCGGVYKIAVGGQLIWRSGFPNPGHWCSCGGGALGPNGLFYTVAHVAGYHKELPWLMVGVVRAYRVSDGSLVWEREFGPEFMGFQYPAVGRIAPRGRLAVLAALGGVTDVPRIPSFKLLEPDWVPFVLKSWWYHNMYLKYSWARALGGVPRRKNGVFALDAETGETIWSTEEPVWDHWAARSDEEDLLRRIQRSAALPREDVICLPDPQGIPVVNGDGTVYASSSHHGDLYAIRDADGDGKISPSEVSIFHAHKEFLNGPSVAPGMLVAAPCWGDVYIFRGSQ